MIHKYQHLALGGTFDRLHLGHEHLLNTAIDSADRLTVGLTTTRLIRDKHLTQLITSYQTRKDELTAFLKAKQCKNFEIIPLHDVYGTTLSDHTIDGIVVTPQTKPGALEINLRRQQLHQKPLPILMASLIKDQAGEYISSTKVRAGLIDRRGMVYAQLFTHDLTIADTHKQMLKQPQGKLIKDPQNMKQVITQDTYTTLIGDIVTQFAIDYHLPFDLAVVDYSNNRKPFDLQREWWQPTHIYQTHNPAGQITAESSKTVFKALTHRNVLLEVRGEEDLLGFPAALNMPLSSTLFYGQPGEGIVMIKVNENTKDKLVQLVKDFEI